MTQPVIRADPAALLAAAGAYQAAGTDLALDQAELVGYLAVPAAGWLAAGRLRSAADSWDDVVVGLAHRLSATGDGLAAAAEDYRATDLAAADRLARARW